MTYVKLSAAVKLDTDTVANLSATVKDNMIQVRDQFQQMAKDILWLNVTFLGQSTLHVMIRQIELTLLQLVQQVIDLLDAIQLAIQGTSIKLINPMKLQSILRNVTLHLPGYELIVGTSIRDIHLYYDLAEVSILVNAHCINTVLNIRLKSANGHFTLFRIIILPTYITSGKFAQYQVDYTYFGLQHKVVTFCFRKQAMIIVKRTALLYVQQTYLYSVHSLLHAKRAYFPRPRLLIARAGGSYSSTPRLHFFTATERLGSSTFRHRTVSPCIATMIAAKSPILYRSSRPAFFTILHSATSLQTNFRRFQSYTARHKQNFIQRSFIFQTSP